MAEPTTHHHLEGRGFGLGIVSAAGFGTSGPFAKALLATGWSPGAAVTARISIGALLLLVPTVRALRGRWHLVRANLAMIVVYGLLAVAGCQLFFFSAVQTLSVGVALLLEYLGLILVVVWLWARHGHRPRRGTVLGVVLAVVGLVLVLDVTGDVDVDLAGALWGLAAAVGLATYFVISAREATGLPPLVMAGGGMVVATAVLAVASGIGVMPMEWSSDRVELGGTALPWWVPVLGLASVAGAFAYVLGIEAARQLGSKVAAFLGLTEVLFAIVFAWALLDELPLPVQLLGGLLIIGGVAVVRYEELTTARTVGAEALPT
jgi:drug/metabolite transporter (DMT)-like permease